MLDFWSQRKRPSIKLIERNEFCAMQSIHYYLNAIIKKVKWLRNADREKHNVDGMFRYDKQLEYCRWNA